MSDYAEKLAAIAAREQKILEEKTKLIEKRKREIASLAERFNLLAASDELLAGIFIECEKALSANDERVKEIKSLGARFLKSKRNASEAEAAAH